MVKVRRSGKLKKGTPSTANDPVKAVTTIMTAAEKWKSRKTPDVKEDLEGVSKEAKEDFTRRYSIDINLLQTIKYTGNKVMNVKKEKAVVNYAVRKTKPKEKIRNVLVLKPAEPDCNVFTLDTVTNYAGPRFTDGGKFIEHSILGSLEDFTAMAHKNGDFLFLQENRKSVTDNKLQTKNPKYNGALGNWNDRIQDWKKTQTFLSAKIHRPVGDLLMRTPNVYPSVVDERIETLAALETPVSRYDDHRVHFPSGILSEKADRESGRIPSSTTKGYDRGDYQPMGFRQIPCLIRNEMDGGEFIPERSYKPYFTPYLQQQKEKVKDIIHILNPYHPDLADLVVKGEGCQKVVQPYHYTTVPRGIVNATPVLSTVSENSELDSGTNMEQKGPVLVVGDRKLTRNCNINSPVSPVSLTFESPPGQIQIQYISLKNCGSTLIHYNWERIPLKNPFGLRKYRRHVFYFSLQGNTLAPGDDVKIPVIFKSNFPGTFKQAWKLKTVPVLCNSADVLINFKASTVTKQLSQSRIESIQNILDIRQKYDVVEETLNGILSRVRTPCKLFTPCCVDGSSEFTPTIAYPGLPRMAPQMKDLYNDICSSDFVSPINKKFSINNLSDIICRLDSIQSPSPEISNYYTILEAIDNKKQWFVDEFCNLTREIFFRSFVPVMNASMRRRHLSTQILQSTVEKFADSSCIIGYKMNIPVLHLQPEENQEEKPKRKRAMSLSVKQGKKEFEAKNGTPPSQGAPIASKNKKKGAQPPVKIPPVAKQEPTQVQQIESFSPIVKEKASATQLEAYKEKIYVQAYLLLQDAIDTMDGIFSIL